MVYRITRLWPSEELCGLTNQVRRAAVSVPVSIAEGQVRIGSKAFGQHLSIACGSLCEVETHFTIANRLNYIDLETLEQLLSQTTDVAQRIRDLMRSLK